MLMSLLTAARNKNLFCLLISNLKIKLLCLNKLIYTYLSRLTCTGYLENHVKFKINIIDFWGSLHHCADYQMPPTELLWARWALFCTNVHHKRNWFVQFAAHWAVDIFFSFYLLGHAKYRMKQNEKPILRLNKVV